MDLGNQGPAGFLFGALPTTIGLMTTLQSIVLDENFFGAQRDTDDPNGGLERVLNALPTEIGLLTSLVQLNMRRNFLFGLVPFDRFVSLPNLSKWDVSNVLSSAMNIPGLHCISQMNLFITDRLNLRENFYDGQIPSTIGDLPQTLAFLDLSANQLTGTIPTEAGRLLQLTDLRLALSDRSPTPDGFCRGASNPLGCLSGTIPTELGLLVNLRSLWLFSNNLTGMLPTQISNLVSLEELFLDKNVISGPVPTLPGALGECVLPEYYCHCCVLLAQARSSSHSQY